jgi:TatD DNase family protein
VRPTGDLGSAVALVDTHCHVDLFPDPYALIRAIERRVIYTIAVTNTPSVFPRLCEMTRGAQFVRPALGLHPELVVERHRELTQFLKLLPTTRYIGEIGLDYQTTAAADRALQRKILDVILEASSSIGGKFLTVHSRRAADDVVSAFGENFRGTYVLHWYSGGIKTLRRAVTNGAYVSFNTAMLGSKRAQAIIAEVPIERVLTETDGPFVSVDDRAAEPGDVSAVVRGLASVWGVGEDDARRSIYSNFARVIRLGEPPTQDHGRSGAAS